MPLKIEEKPVKKAVGDRTQNWLIISFLIHSARAFFLSEEDPLLCQKKNLTCPLLKNFHKL